MRKILAILAIVLFSSVALAQNTDEKIWYSIGQIGAAPPQFGGNEYAKVLSWENLAGVLCIPQADANCNLFTAPGAGAIWEVRVRDGNGATLADVSQPSALATNWTDYFLNTAAAVHGISYDVNTQFLPALVLAGAGQRDNVLNNTPGLITTNFLYGFDGATWDRIDAPAHADNLANATNGLNSSAFLYGFDGATWDRVYSAYFPGNFSTTENGLMVVSGNYFWDIDNNLWIRDQGDDPDSDAVATTQAAPYRISFGLLYQTDSTNWSRDQGETADGGNIAATADGAYRLALNYGWNGTNWSVLNVGAVGELQVTDVATRPGEDAGNDWRKVKKEEIATATPVVEQTAAIGTAAVTCFASREVLNDVNWCIYVENTDGVDPMTDVDINVSPDNATWIDLGWAACDALAAGSACVYCVSGNAYRYIRVRCAAADANQASTDIWYTSNKD